MKSINEYLLDISSNNEILNIISEVLNNEIIDENTIEESFLFEENIFESNEDIKKSINYFKDSSSEHERMIKKINTIEQEHKETIQRLNKNYKESIERQKGSKNFEQMVDTFTNEYQKKLEEENEYYNKRRNDCLEYISGLSKSKDSKNLQAQLTIILFEFNKSLTHLSNNLKNIYDSSLNIKEEDLKLYIKIAKNELIDDIYEECKKLLNTFKDTFDLYKKSLNNKYTANDINEIIKSLNLDKCIEVQNSDLYINDTQITKELNKRAFGTEERPDFNEYRKNNSKENDDSNKENKSSEENVKDTVTDQIKDNKDLLTPLAKEANITGEKLRDIITKVCLDKKGKPRKLDESVILGLSIMLCGVILTIKKSGKSDNAAILAVTNKITSIVKNKKSIKNTI